MAARKTTTKAKSPDAEVEVARGERNDGTQLAHYQGFTVERDAENPKVLRLQKTGFIGDPTTFHEDELPALVKLLQEV